MVDVLQKCFDVRKCCVTRLGAWCMCLTTGKAAERISRMSTILTQPFHRSKCVHRISNLVTAFIDVKMHSQKVYHHHTAFPVIKMHLQNVYHPHRDP